MESGKESEPENLQGDQNDFEEKTETFDCESKMRPKVSSAVSDTIPSEQPCDEEDISQYQEILSRDSTVLSAYWADKYEKEASKNWDKFYKRNETNFFKDRHYLDREFEELHVELTECEQKGERRCLLEVGCGVGNTIFPLLEKNPSLCAYGVDFSPRAIQRQERYDPTRCAVFVCDMTQDPLPEAIPPLDYATMVFVLSAIHPEKMPAAVQKVYDRLKPGGWVFFRDYARFDLTMLRFKPGSKIAENFYVRWDGTRTAFFTRESLAELFGNAGFVIKENLYHRKTITNKKTGQSMKRVWLQLRCQKPLLPTPEDSSSQS
eukprot:TRINITY_DN3787_c0_g3_i1.p1 TRINITY_DN3787_c0_g3~~TRINITY_DN3787_c0_g3_i1.p1  ORF type:complete len:337 (-),score=92.10 TRINITY_DN3787_c0_g3_i1:52-1011(-)